MSILFKKNIPDDCVRRIPRTIGTVITVATSRAMPMPIITFFDFEYLQ